MNPLNILFTNNRHFNIFYGLMMLSVVTLPFSHACMLPIGILMLLNWIWEWNWKEKWNNIKDNKAILPIIFSSALIVIPLYGLIISSNKMHALSSLENYSFFLVLPCIIFSYASTMFTHERIRALLVLFAASTILLTLILGAETAIHFLQSDKSEFSAYAFISTKYHPSYLSLYATVAILLILFELKMRRRTMPKALKVVYALLAVFLYISIVNFSSKAGIILLFVTCLVWIFYLTNTWRQKLIGVLLYALLNVSFGFLLCQFHNSPITRLKSAWETVKNFGTEEKAAYTSSGIRLTLWKVSGEIAVSHHLLGTGTGDFEEELVQVASQNGLRNLEGHHYNAHCQYLQSLATTGLLGLLLLLGYLCYHLYYSIHKKDMLLGTFTLLVAGNILVESMLERRAGVVFIIILFVLLFLRIPKAEIHFDLGPTEEETT